MPESNIVMERWDDTFPSALLLSYQMAPSDSNIVSTAMDAGIDRVRTRYTRSLYRANVSFVMDSTYFWIFQAWFAQRIHMGTKFFLMELPSPFGMRDHQVRFVKKYTAKPISDNKWSIDAELDIKYLPILGDNLLSAAMADPNILDQDIFKYSNKLHTVIHTDLPQYFY